ncbi:hypothetical protein LEP1GSC171_0495 [Leptospira santarosai str. HAI1380]|uniref:Uncharacterized protein n=1 Tax=Leptospira santarosai str. MOR084 TaxID=1049984 RepID=A0A0E2BAY5_9LEPT|nr:hypothetical protein [Leptospira santarosai]EKO32503.1 hypothetical protein LEP1GSC179_2240 [Leptospira santarosai str. MOR084]EMP03170.1 hypothetical protein LEP1GSC171_0495 [Leptospira santarosai str. HAI1380]
MCPKPSSSRIALEYEFSFLFRPIHAKTIIMLRSVKSSIEFENSVGIGAESAVREPGRIRPIFLLRIRFIRVLFLPKIPRSFVG